MAKLLTFLDLDKCPHCGVDRPSLQQQSGGIETTDQAGANRRFWIVYVCKRCGGATLASAPGKDKDYNQIFPNPITIHQSIPDKARSYLSQAVSTQHAPSGSIMLAASSVDAMLKAKGYKDGSLYSRIQQASTDHVITDDMAQWAHEVRLEANDERHSEEGAALPDENDARLCLEFALALGEFIFVLPARVQRGLKSSQVKSAEA